MYTKDFEYWWAKNQAQVLKGRLTDDLVCIKQLAWEAWRAGREKMYEQRVA